MHQHLDTANRLIDFYQIFMYNFHMSYLLSEVFKVFIKNLRKWNFDKISFYFILFLDKYLVPIQYYFKMKFFNSCKGIFFFFDKNKVFPL